MAFLVKCTHCGKKYRYGSECDCSGKIEAQKRREKYYDKVVRNKDKSRLYHSKKWKDLTEQCKLKFYGLDIYEYYKYGNITQGLLSHHIIEVDDDDNRVFDLSNLMYLTVSSHNEIHSMYNKSKEHKRKMQEYLFSIINRFENEYTPPLP